MIADMPFRMTGRYHGGEETVSWDEGVMKSSMEMQLAVERILHLDEPLPATPEGPFYNPSLEDPMPAYLTIGAAFDEVTGAEGDLPAYEDDVDDPQAVR